VDLIQNRNGPDFAITGGSSGIGLAVAKIMSSRGAQVAILDICEPQETLPAGIRYQKCDISSWTELSAAFSTVGPVHIAIANAGQGEDGSYLTDAYDEHGHLLEPKYNVIDTNFRGTLNFIKLALHNMKKNSIEGSVVITSSATAYSAEQSLPVYSGTKAAVRGQALVSLSNISTCVFSDPQL
jgi:NAD(P)-dependent dehydrogenase (short-subunit alcohol dehydrogenase family)